LQGGQGNQQGIGTARGLLPDGMNAGDITAISNNNTILVRYPDTPEGEAMFRELQTRIRLLDVKPKQIQVRAQFVTLLQQDADQFGINWQFQKVNLVGQLNAGYSPSGQALLQFATGNLQMQLNFALTTGRGKVVASPMSTTFNNVPAIFSNNTTYYAFIPQTFIGPGGAAQTTYYPDPINAFSQLFITPRINGDNTLTLTGSLSFADLTGTATAPDGTSIPIITTQNLPQVTRIIRNGDTMVLAGLIRKTDQADQQSVPLLGELPLIGSLFRSRSINTDDSELLVFITATILNDPIPTGSVGGGSGLITLPGGPTGNQ
jgi:type II secretory pathway component GspD/PulD (secretin)